MVVEEESQAAVAGQTTEECGLEARPSTPSHAESVCATAAPQSMPKTGECSVLSTHRTGCRPCRLQRHQPSLLRRLPVHHRVGPPAGPTLLAALADVRRPVDVEVTVVHLPQIVRRLVRHRNVPSET